MKNTHEVNSKDVKPVEPLTVAGRLKAGGKVFSVEFYHPDIRERREALFRNAKKLKAFSPDFVFTTDVAGAEFGKAVSIIKRLKVAAGGDLVACLTCAKHSRGEIAGICARLKAIGVKNILALRGGMNKLKGPVAGRDWQHASRLIEEVKKTGGFCLGGACYPEKHPEAPTLESDINRLKEKVDAGAEYLVTQYFFDNSSYFRFLEKTAAAGINVPILPGLLPIHTYLDGAGRNMEVAMPKPLRHGIDRWSGNRNGLLNFSANYALTQATELLRGGAPGVHIYTLNHSFAAEVILKNLRGAR